MNSKLMYGEGKEQDWNYTNNPCRIENLSNKDNNDKKNNASEPRVSIPSPYARFELVQKAFANYVKYYDTPEKYDTRDLILISHALDLLELFYENPDDMSFEQWNKREAIEELQGSKTAGNKLFGDTLAQYSRQEKYGFDADDTNITIVKFKNDILGCTSPTSIFLATPRYENIGDIRIEGSNKLYDKNPRMLFSREADFVKYVYEIASQFREKNTLGAFIDYLEKMSLKIRRYNSDLYDDIANWKDTTTNNLEERYFCQLKATLYGQPLYQRRREDVAQQVASNSDFILQGAKNGSKPMILTNQCPYSGLSYITKNEKWSLKNHAIDYSTTHNPSKREDLLVPGTNVQYEWLCENDFLSDIIIQVPYPIDDKHFFSGTSEIQDSGFFLPLKDKFFEYFDIEYLSGSNGNTRNYEIKVIRDSKKEISSVIVSLSLPIKGGKPLTLKKEYIQAESKNEALRGAAGLNNKHKDKAIGYILECPLAISIFPFARLEENNIYRVMLALGMNEDMKDFSIDLIPRRKNTTTGKDYNWKGEPYHRTNRSTFYTMENDFDFLQIKISDGGYCEHVATCMPLWSESSNGTKQYSFAFDFGTTNSYIAVKEANAPTFEDFKLGSSIVSTINAASSDTNDTDVVMMEIRKRQEFLPSQIGDFYKFPLRTVILQNQNFDVKSETPYALQHVNIPFIYGKEDYNANQNDLKSNLKWSNRGNEEEQQRLASAFIEEMLFLSHVFVIENKGNLKSTHITWTYPLSMPAIKRMHNDVWIKWYKKYFMPNISDDDCERRITRVTESIAPLLYYSEEGKMLSADLELSVDIGGGTCDTVIKNGNDKIIINSFRFAADVIFGAGRANENRMVQKWYKKFSSSLSKLDVNYFKLLRSVCTSGQYATEANSLLFALETLEQLKGVDIADKSYNIKLSSDGNYKIIFLYFYGAIIYYLAHVIQILDFQTEPGTIYFSGTGSKLLNIIGTKSELQELTTKMLKLFGNFDYGKQEIRIIIESEEPKQLTAKGALTISRQDKKETTKSIIDSFSTSEDIKANTLYSSLTKKKGLTYNDAKNIEIQEEVINQVKEYNKLFLQLAKEMNFKDEFSCDTKSIESLNKYMDNDLLIGLQSDIEDFPEPEETDGLLHESLFFYPIKRIIRNLIIEE